MTDLPKAISAKKSLGQHFLLDSGLAQRITNLLTPESLKHTIIEVGPGTGSLTEMLLQKTITNLQLVEIDQNLILYLKKKYPAISDNIIAEDFLTLSFSERFKQGPLAIIGNFPYYISSQILFKILDNRHLVNEVVGMVQKEVAERLTAQPGSKRYGIPSLLLQAFYTIHYCFTVSPHVFSPAPKVDSAVITMHRNNLKQLPCKESLFFQIVKSSFQQRRKKLRNALHAFNTSRIQGRESAVLHKRAEELSIAEFIQLTNLLDHTV